MVRECPNCGVVNPPTALQCDCGYEFASGRIINPPVVDPRRTPVVWLRLLAGCAGTVFGVIIGVWVAVTLQMQAASQAADALRDQGQHVCGLFALGYLFVGVVWGTILGGLAGLIASLLIGWSRIR
jgi:hypothetical protein